MTQSSATTSLPANLADILAPTDVQPELLERIAHRQIKQPMAIVEPNPEWPRRFEEVRSKIQHALGESIVDIAHTGSTSVPDLPAKDVIDIDLSLKDVIDEASYVKPLEDLGLRFLLREPHWHQHRFFAEDRPGQYAINLHVWNFDSPEVTRHRIFRDWLRKTPADRNLYADIKRKAATETMEASGALADYNLRKQNTIREILDRAFRDLGYIK